VRALELGLVPARGARLLVALVLALGLAACGPAISQTQTPIDQLESPIEGVITNVVSAGLDQVTEFTIRTADGTILRFRIGILENGAEFPPGHLTEHQATSDPIRVTFHLEDGELVATRLEDAEG
jgi:hypothetical protein